MDTSTLRRVLLVEDDIGDAELVGEYLAVTHAPRHEVVHVVRLEEARQLAIDSGFDVALLDLRLPDAAGIECVRALRASAPSMPLVVLTGLDDEALALDCIAAGAQDYLTKHELHPHALTRTIAHAVARAAEAAARARADDLQARLAAIVDASADAIVGIALDGSVSTWNHGAAAMFGYGADEAIGRPFGEVIRAAPGPDSEHQQHRLEQTRLGRGTGVPEELVRFRRDGSPVTVSIVTSALPNAAGEITQVAVICRDVTEVRRQSDELRRVNQQLLERQRQMRALAARISAVREQERALISREVHDELGQLLTGIKMDLRWVQRRIEAKSASPRALVDRLAETDALVDNTIATVQRISVELRPSALDSLGLVAAVRDEARRFEARSGIATLVEVGAGLPSPPPDVATAMFRILQELMSNVVRHSHARSLRIALREVDDQWRMEVHDDGVGLPVGATTRSDALGLLGMTERAVAIGGRFTIRTGESGGTVAVVIVPMHGTTA